MQKLIVTLVLLGACRTTTSTITTMTAGPSPAATPGPVTSAASSAAQTGAADVTGAVRGFMAAAKGSDLHALSSFWGDKEGPARDKMARDELEKRELYMIRCLRHDHYEIAGDAPALDDSRAVVLNLNFGEVSRSADMQVVRGPADRWYVKDVNLAKLQDICMSRG